MKQKLYLLVLIMCCFASAKAQSKKTGLIRGRLINQETKEPIHDVQLSMPEARLLAISSGEGGFLFSQVPYGPQIIVISGSNLQSDTIKVDVNESWIDLGDISIASSIVNNNTSAQSSVQIPTIALEDNDISNGDDGAKAQAVSGLLSASRDPFQNTAAYIWGTYRFQPRGYDRNQQMVLINGAPMNDVETGDAYWSQWGGLNDVFRARSNTYGLQTSEYTYGGINGSTYFDATAANQRQQTKVTYTAANRQYTGRIMLTHSTGLMKGGWAFSASVSRRWASEGYIDGTFYDGYSYYLAASKKAGTKHQFNLTTFGAPTDRGKSAPATQETFDIAGSNFYNPNWGYQNGEMRNAKVSQSFQPVIILNHEYTPNAKTRINTAIAYQFGRNGNTTLDWYNAPDPRPDYYGYLPSYYINNYSPNEQQALTNMQRFNNGHNQVAWDDLYNVNYMNRVATKNYSGYHDGADTARRSLYVLANDIDDIKKATFNTTITHIVNESLKLTGGVTFLTQRTESYRRLDDLLGGDFYVNVNQFAERNNVGSVVTNQNNLLNPNQVLHVGDKYYYDYITRFTKSWAWAQANFTFNHFDFFLAANAGFNSFSREGLYQNGLYADASLGKSPTESFFTYSAKGGATYKMDGRNYLYLNGTIAQDPPTIDNTFISARTRNYTVDNPTTQKTYSLEGGYLRRAPKANIRVSGYVTDVKDATEIKRFFMGGTANTFINFAMQGVNMRFIGTEMAIDYKLSPSISLLGTAAVGQAFYTNNVIAKRYDDNVPNSNGAPTATKNVYIKDYYLGVGAQSAYTAGINYRSKKYYFINLNVNYFDRNYVDISPDKRSEEAVDMLTPGSAEWNSVLNQEKLPSAITMDLFAGKSFLPNKVFSKIPRSVVLSINAGINNLLNNKNVRTGGFENLRYDYAGGNAFKFPNKYFYAYGRNFIINISLKF